jgi:hypothetical protein
MTGNFPSSEPFLLSLGNLRLFSSLLTCAQSAPTWVSLQTGKNSVQNIGWKKQSVKKRVRTFFCYSKRGETAWPGEF